MRKSVTSQVQCQEGQGAESSLLRHQCAGLLRFSTAYVQGQATLCGGLCGAS